MPNRTCQRPSPAQAFMIDSSENNGGSCKEEGDDPTTLPLLLSSTIIELSSQNFEKSVWRNSDRLTCAAFRSAMKFHDISLSLVIGKSPSQLGTEFACLLFTKIGTMGGSIDALVSDSSSLVHLLLCRDVVKQGFIFTDGRAVLDCPFVGMFSLFGSFE